MVFAPLTLSCPTLLLNLMPSTMINGSLPSEIELAPRILMREPPPTVPPACATSTLATFPVSS